MISAKLDEIERQVREEFGKLDRTQLNLRPAADKWSIAQCLDHLIISNETYIPEFELLLGGNYKHTFWQRLNPFTSIAGKKGVEILQSDKIKLKAPAIFAPAQNDIEGDIVDRFITHQQQMKSYFDRMETKDMSKEIINSPAVHAVTLKVGDVMEIIAAHEKRHVLQAINVKKECVEKK